MSQKTKRVNIRITQEQFDRVKELNLSFTRLLEEAIERKTKRRVHTRTDTVQTYIDALDLIYQKYPRKEGKSQGYKRLGTLDEWELECLEIAIDNYLHHLKTNRIEPRYIKMFSTFAGEWRDWVHYEKGSKNVSNESSSL